MSSNPTGKTHLQGLLAYVIFKATIHLHVSRTRAQPTIHLLALLLAIVIFYSFHKNKVNVTVLWPFQNADPYGRSGIQVVTSNWPTCAFSTTSNTRSSTSRFWMQHQHFQSCLHVCQLLFEWFAEVTPENMVGAHALEVS